MGIRKSPKYVQQLTLGEESYLRSIKCLERRLKQTFVEDHYRSFIRLGLMEPIEDYESKTYEIFKRYMQTLRSSLYNACFGINTTFIKEMSSSKIHPYPIDLCSLCIDYFSSTELLAYNINNLFFRRIENESALINMGLPGFEPRWGGPKPRSITKLAHSPYRK